MFKEKQFTFNNIKQLNRNSLLWQDDSIDGIKTGHTSDAGYCLVASAKRGDMRLIAIVLNSASEKTRLQDSRRLLDYGFRFFKTKKILDKYQQVTTVDVWAGTDEKLVLGPSSDIYLTLTKPQFKNLEVIASKNLGIKAPIIEGQAIDSMDVVIEGKVHSSFELVAISNVNSKGFIRSSFEALAFYVYSFFMQDEVK
mgnify:FL=1